MIRRPAMLNEQKESRASFIVLCVIFVIVLIIVILDLLRIFCLMTIEIKGDSMLDTLYGGERVLVDGTGDYEGGDIVYAVRGNRAERGDIVIIDTTDSSAYDPDGHAVFTANIIVKRLIAVEGDCVKCEQGVVYLNCAGSGYAPLAESYVRGRTPDFSEVRVGEGEIFFLGDNRTLSADSEDIVRDGYDLLTVDDIMGVVPAWAVSVKGFSTAWENFRSAIYGIFA